MIEWTSPKSALVAPLFFENMCTSHFQIAGRVCQTRTPDPPIKILSAPRFRTPTTSSWEGCGECAPEAAQLSKILMGGAGLPSAPRLRSRKRQLYAIFEHIPAVCPLLLLFGPPCARRGRISPRRRRESCDIFSTRHIKRRSNRQVFLDRSQSDSFFFFLFLYRKDGDDDVVPS